MKRFLLFVLLAAGIFITGATAHAAPPSLRVTTTALADAYVGTSYTQTLTASGGKTPYTWSITAGALPEGLALSGSGVISGPPPASGSSSFTVQVRDASNNTATKALSISAYAALSVASSMLPDCSAGIPYSQTLQATGGKTPYAWSVVAGVLPTGLALGGDGVISGTATAAGASNFTVQAKDANNVAATQPLSITVNAGALAVATAALPDAYVGAGYSQPLAAVGGAPPYSWSIARGALPAGLVLGSSGTISGVPTAAGSATFTVQVADTDNAIAARSLIIDAYAAPPVAGTVDVATLFPPAATIRTNHEQMFTVSATNDKAFTLGLYHVELAYTAGLTTMIYSTSPYTASAKVDTTKRLVVIEWSSVAPGTTLTASFSASGSTPGTYAILPSKLYYKDSGRTTYNATCNAASITVEPDLDAPSPPKNARSASADGSIRIYWTRGTEDDIGGYNIYRRTPTTGFVRMNAQPLDSYTSWTEDTNVLDGATYRYVITAVDTSGNESPYSTETGETYYNSKIRTYNAAGATVAAIGDIDGDGRADTVFGFPDYCSHSGGGNPACEGKVEIYFGGNTTGSPDVVILGENGSNYNFDKFGSGVAVVDLNNDGYNELVVGAPEHDADITSAFSDEGKVYVYAGGPQFNTNPVWTMNGSRSYGGGSVYYVSENLGYSVAAGGDVNGDGFDDVVIGAPLGGSSRSGAVVILYGGPDLSVLGTSRISGGVIWSYMGSSVALGDIYSDGVSDILTGAPSDSHWSTGARAYLFSQGPESQPTREFSIGTGSGFGSFVSVIGDFNGDGFSDVTVDKYLYYGGRSMDTDRDIIITGYAYSNRILSLGDVNGDGLSDIVAFGPNVYFGNRSDQRLPDISREGSGILATGDVDGDGVRDVVVTGASSAYAWSVAPFLGLPEIAVLSPINGSSTGSPVSAITGAVRGSLASLTVGGQQVSIMPDNTFNSSVPLLEGENVIEILGEMPDGRISKRTLTITYSPLIPPLVLSITSPADGETVYGVMPTISGTISDSAARVTVNGVAATISGNGFSATGLRLVEGPNTITAKAIDGYFRIASHGVTVNHVPGYGGITGTVVDNVTGNPIAAAGISVTDPMGRTFTATTDSSGHFALDNVSVGTVTGTVGGVGYVPQPISAEVAHDQATVVDCALIPYARITGTITHQALNVPLSGVRVTATDSTDDWHEAFSDVNGVFTLYVHPGTVYMSYIYHDGYWGHDPGFWGPLSAGETVRVDSALVQSTGSAIISGTVTDALTGASVQSAQVQVDIGGICARTAVSDSWGTYTITCSTSWTYPFTGSVTADSYQTANVAGTAVVGTITFLNVQLAPSDRGMISGRVTDAATGAGIAAATVSVTDGGGTPFSAATDSNGNYALVIGEGAFSGTASKPGYAITPISGTVSIGQVTTANVALPAVLPVVNGLTVTNVTSNSARISWTTDQISSSRVDYGTTISYGATVSDAALVTSHSLNLTGLAAGTTYHFRVVSTNEYGNSSSSTDNTFRTLSALPNPGSTDNVMVIEVSGGYDAKNPDGSVNDAPRQDVARAYFASRPEVDFLITLSTFDYAMPEAGANGFYLEVRNDTQGINRPLLNNSSLYGSAGMLQGIVELGNVTTLAAAPFGPKLDETLTVLGHELMHRYGAYVRYLKPDLTLSTALLGKDAAHWSYLLDTKGSLMYGSGWRDNGNGTFTATAGQSVYSPLDLYLMGMIPKEQVPAMRLIDNAAIDPTQLPQLGATVAGAAATVTIDDVVAAEGDRIPNAAASQKQFTVGFALLIRSGDNTVAGVQAVETVRKAFAGRFAALTQANGSIGGVAPEMILHVDSPADNTTVVGPDVTVTGAVINTTGTETGVLVNGIPATLSGCRFTAAYVPLDNGANTITVMATDNIALTAMTTIYVTAALGDYLRVVPNIQSGLAPLAVSLRLDGSFAIDNPAIMVSGPVAVPAVAVDNGASYTANLPVEGTYTITASAVGPGSQTYTDTVTISVMSRQAMESLLRRKWDGMKQAIIGGNIDTAMTYFVPFTQDRYRNLANDPSMELAARLAEIERLDLRIMEGKMAEAAAIRTEDAGKISYPVTFVLDDYGVWKILGF